MNRAAKDKTILIFINFFAQMLFVFYSIFFNIYILSIVNDINFVLIYNLYVCCVRIFAQALLTKLLSSKNFNTVYRLSFFMLLISTVFVFFITEELIYLVFVVGLIYGFSEIFFYVPHEIIVMGKNETKGMKKYLGVSSLVSSISGILSPFISGFIIGKVSFTVLCVILLVFASCALILSCLIKNTYMDKSELNYKQFLSEAKKDKKLKTVYLGYGFYRIFESGTIAVLLPVLLFIKTGSEFSVGIYKTIISIAALAMLFVYTFFICYKKTFTFGGSIIIIISSILLVVIPTFETFIIYFFIQNIVTKYYNNAMNESLFTAINNTKLENCKKYHHMTFSLISNVFVIISYIVAIIIYNFVRTDLMLSIFIGSLSIFTLLSSILLTQSDKIKRSNKDVYNNL